jgi:hypothetical protein
VGEAVVAAVRVGADVRSWERAVHEHAVAGLHLGQPVGGASAVRVVESRVEARPSAAVVAARYGARFAAH